MKVYIVGKITGDLEYWAKFANAAAVIEQQGYNNQQRTIVLNPADLPEGMSKADYMRIRFAMIDAADLCVFMPDWEESRGARLERAYCEYIGKRTETWKD